VAGEAEVMDREVALLSGLRGEPEVRYRLFRSSLVGEVGEELRPAMQGAQVTLSNFRDHTWELSLIFEGELPVREDGDWARLFAEVRDGDEWRRYRLGLYSLTVEEDESDPVLGSWSVTGRSPEVVLAENVAYRGYRVGAGTGVLAEGREIMRSLGVPDERIVLPTQDVPLNTDMWFDPFQDFSGVYYLRIVNALFNAGGFRAVYADADGRLTTEKLEDSRGEVADALYSSRSEVGGLMVTGPVRGERDRAAFANRVVVYAGDPNETTPVVGVAENHDANSPGSIENLGRVVQNEPIQVQNIVSQQEADRLALAELRRRSSMERKLSLSTFPDPRRGARETYDLDLWRDNGEPVATGLWDVIGWTWPLTSPPSPMSHELSRRVAL